MKFNLAVKGIIQRNDGKILIVKRSRDDDHKPGVWETVGGGIDIKTSPQRALQKEIKEEVNLDVEVKEPFNVFTFTKDNGEFKVGITFICQYKKGKVKLSEEHSEYKWIKAKDFKKDKAAPSLYKEIMAYVKKYEQ
jgi:8-oxo-dGTP diphosphatase